MPARSHAERVMIAKLATHERWRNVADRTAETGKLRAGLEAKFLREVPEHITDPEARRKAAESARKAFYAKLALRSAQARRARSNAKKLAAEVTEMTALAAGDVA